MANTSVFVYFSVKEWLSKQSSEACLSLFWDSVIMFSLSDVLYDEGNILNYDNTCPCNPLRRKKSGYN